MDFAAGAKGAKTGGRSPSDTLTLPIFCSALLLVQYSSPDHHQTTPSRCSHGLLHQLRQMNIKTVFPLKPYDKGSKHEDVEQCEFDYRCARWFIPMNIEHHSCLCGVTWKHCQFCSCCVCAGLRAACFWQEASSLAVCGGYCNLDQGMQLVQLVIQKAKNKDTLKPVSFSSCSGYRVKFQWVWTVCSSSFATEAWGAFDLVLVLHEWAWVGPSKVAQRCSSASEAVPSMR